MTLFTPNSAAERDNDNFRQVDSGSISEMLAFAAKKSGRSVLQLGREFHKLSKSYQQINISEFIRWQLYDRERHDEAALANFISRKLHWPIAHQCNDRSWQSAAEDKALAATLLAAGGVTVPETVAVVDQSSRIYPGLRKVSTADEMRDFLNQLGRSNLFGKVMDGMVSLGAFSLDTADETHITCSGHEPMTYEFFMSEFLGGNAYLLQTRLENHPQIAPWCSALATVRVVNMVSEDRVLCPLAVISMPQGENIADTLWRPGNIACEVDVESGKIKTVVTRNGPEIEFLPDHPSREGWMGTVLPHWDALREMNEKAARIFAPIRYQSTDIAITENGPVIVELNYGGGFGLPQNASGRGLLTPEVRAFFESCGVEFGRAKKRRLGIFGG